MVLGASTAVRPGFFAELKKQTNFKQGSTWSFHCLPTSRSVRMCTCACKLEAQSLSLGAKEAYRPRRPTQRELEGRLASRKDAERRCGQTVSARVRIPEFRRRRAGFGAYAYMYSPKCQYICMRTQDIDIGLCYLISH